MDRRGFLGSLMAFLVLLFVVLLSTRRSDGSLGAMQRETPPRQSHQPQAATALADMKQRQHVARVFREMSASWWELSK